MNKKKIVAGTNGDQDDKSPQGEMSIENASIRVSFNLDTGRYSIAERATGSIIMQNATMGLSFQHRESRPGWYISDENIITERSAKIMAVNDSLGRGQTLRITATVADSNPRLWEPDRPGRAELELSLTLYDDRSALVLGFAIRNNLSRALLIQNFTPLADAEMWPSDRERTQPQTLDGYGAYGFRAERSGLHAYNAVKAGFSRESENNLLLTYRCGSAGPRRNVVAGGLTYCDYLKRVSTRTSEEGQLLVTLHAYDPVGRLLNSGEEYRSNDRFYFDLTSDDPFLGLEEYAKSAAAAQGAKPNLYNFPTLCMWYVMVTSDQREMTTVAAVRQMDHIAQSGFLRYSPVAVRLVPERYHHETGGDTPHGWWDDAHWQKHGYYKEPYETSEKFCKAIRERGGLPFTYVQTGMPSDDFAQAHPDWMLNKDIKYLKLLPRPHEQPHVRMDYSNPGLQNHLRTVWRTLGEAGLAGVMFDYPETGFAGEGGLEDPHSTATAAYRKIFELAREGLGPQAHIHERNLAEVSTQTTQLHQRIPYSDMTLGLVDSQRIETDTSNFTAAQVARGALRWYKNRVFFMYDTDSKSLLFREIHTRTTSEPPDATLRRRSMLTMLYATSSRLVLADSFSELSPSIIHDLSRLYPMHEQRRTFRPVDLFLPSAAECPRVFKFNVEQDWIQVVLFNPDMTAGATVSTPLSGDAVLNGGLELDPGKEYYVYDFWNDRLAGRLKGTDLLAQELTAGEARMFSLRTVQDKPQVLSTDRHVMQGMIELSDLYWVVADEGSSGSGNLRGKANMVPGETMRIVVANNGHTPVGAFAAQPVSARLEPHNADANIAILSLDLDGNEAMTVDWQINYSIEVSAG